MPHSTAASPCPWGPGGLYFDFQDNSALLGSQHCCVPWPAGLPWGGGLWLGGWFRFLVTFCQTLCIHLQPSSGPRALLSWVSTLVSLFPWFCTPPAPQGSPFPPWPTQAHAVVEGKAQTLSPGHLSSAWLQHQPRRAKGFLLPKGVFWYRGLWPKSIPVPCTPGLCPAPLGCARGAVEFLEAASRDTTGPPCQGHVFPNHQKPPAFEQTLYHGATGREGALEAPQQPLFLC